MALATRCPHCETIFRVASDQLKLRAGLVRCGTCKEIFNGIENLQHPEIEGPLATSPAETRKAPETSKAYSKSAADVAMPGKSLEADEIAQQNDQSDDDDVSEPAFGTTLDEPPAVVERDFAANSQEKPDENAGDKPDFSYSNDVSKLKDNADTVILDQDANGHQEGDLGLEHDVESDENPPTNIAIATEKEHEDREQSELPEKVEEASIQNAVINPGTILIPSFENPTPVATSSTEDLPDFVKRGRNKLGRARLTRVVLRIALLIFLVCLAAQVLYAFRSTLAASFPQMRQSLENACQLLGCRVALPMQIDAISIESSDFQPITGNREQFALYVLLRNRSTTVQVWPDIELTLTDTNDKPMASRIIVPKEYLLANRNEKDGFSAGAEQSIKLYFSLPQLKAAGYRVYLFYP